MKAACTHYTCTQVHPHPHTCIHTHTQTHTHTHTHAYTHTHTHTWTATWPPRIALTYTASGTAGVSTALTQGRTCDGKPAGWGDVRCRCKMGLLKVDLNFEQHVFYAVSVYIKSVGWCDVRCRCKMGLLKVNLNFEQQLFYAVSAYISLWGGAMSDADVRWAC